MFSITPTTRRKLRLAMSAARWATFCAASAGVVTTIRSVCGSIRARPICTSPVPGRHVDEEVVEVAPAHVAQELLDRLGEHEPAPHQGGLLFDEEAGRHDLQQAVADDALVRDDQRLGRAVDADWASIRSLMPEQARHRETPDVGVEHPDGVTRVAASAAARLTVTELLPTPPLPLAMASTRHEAGTSVSGAFSRAFQRALVIADVRSSAFISPHTILTVA